MSLVSTNPATGLINARFPRWSPEQLEQALQQVAEATPPWAAVSLDERARLMHALARCLRQKKNQLARLISEEMGKLITEAEAEVEKSALGCEYYAENSARFLADEIIESDAGRSLVCYQPLGTVLAIMPWNFPFWQVMRFAAPALMAGNTALLKHASNVPRCALALEQLFLEAGFPDHVFRSLMIGSEQVAGLIADRRVHAVTLTGSTPAGRQVAAQAGAQLKKTVLELGGSDPFIVLEDAELEAAVETALLSRFMNCGQSCIAAKRFIVVEDIADAFVTAFKAAVETLRPGDPLDRSTNLAPMARLDLRDELHRQVQDSLAAGAEAVTGCHPLPGDGAFYAASILDRVVPGMPAYTEELFGPVASIIRAQDAEDALRIANDSDFGLGGSVWTRNLARGEALARRLQCGNAFVNGLVKSDPRLPFGGIKTSGYGRELSRHGQLEFVNIKTLWIR